MFFRLDACLIIGKAGMLRLDLFEPNLSYHIKIKKTTRRVVFLFGGDNRTRTCDLMRVKHAL